MYWCDMELDCYKWVNCLSWQWTVCLFLGDDIILIWGKAILQGGWTKTLQFSAYSRSDKEETLRSLLCLGVRTSGYCVGMSRCAWKLIRCWGLVLLTIPSQLLTLLVSCELLMFSSKLWGGVFKEWILEYCHWISIQLPLLTLWRRCVDSRNIHLWTENWDRESRTLKTLNYICHILLCHEHPL